jgi:trigger factor
MAQTDSRGTTLDTARMRVNLQKHERWRRTLWITLPADVVQRERERALRQLTRRLKVPGYRKASAVEHHTPAVIQETLHRLMQEAYTVALRERGLQPISEGEIEALDHQPGGDLTFGISFEVRPTIELGRLGGFRVERSRPTVGSTDVDQVLERVRVENAIWRPADSAGRPVPGDLVTIEIERIQETSDPTAGALDDVGLPWLRRLRLRADSQLGRRFQLVLGEGDALPALEDAVRSLAPGQSGEFVIPSDPDSTAGCAELRLRVTLQDRRMRDLPELDDAFARSLGDYEDVESLRRQILADLEEEAEELAQDQLAVRLLDQVLEANPFDVPATMVSRWIDTALGDVRQAEPNEVAVAREQLQTTAETAVRRMLAVEWIASRQALAATPEEVEGRIADLAQLGQVTPEEVRSRLVKSGRLEGVARDITERKVLAFLESQSEVVEPEA